MKGNQIQLGDIKNQTQIFRLKKCKLNVQNVRKSFTCLHLYKDTLYLGTRTSKLYIYRIEGSDLLNQKVLVPHCQIVSSITANDNYFVTIAESDEQMPVSIWDTKTNMFITALKSHESQVSKAIFLSEQGWFATSSWDCTVKVWDLRNILEWQNNIKTIKSEYPVLTIAQVNRDVIAFGGDDCYINFYNWKSMQNLGKFFGHAGSVTLIYTKLPYILTAGGDHKLKQWQFNIPIHTSNQLQQAIQQRIQIPNQPNPVIKMSRQIKKTYDSSIFLIELSQSNIFLLDRHGARFVHRFGKQFVPCQNDFQYNENITGMAIYQGKIYVTTTKGELKCYEIETNTNIIQ